MAFMSQLHRKNIFDKTTLILCHSSIGSHALNFFLLIFVHLLFKFFCWTKKTLWNGFYVTGPQEATFVDNDQRQTKTNDKHWPMTNTDQWQKTTNHKQRPTTINDQRQTTTNDKQRPMTNDKQRLTTNNDQRQTTTNDNQ